MARWLALSLGLAVAAVALYVLVGPRRGGPPLDDIDAASRARLERALHDEGAAR